MSYSIAAVWLISISVVFIKSFWSQSYISYFVMYFSIFIKEDVKLIFQKMA